MSCIGVVGETGKCLMVDATPDFAAQLVELSKAAGRTPPGVDAMILTHAHIGHYLGLALLLNFANPIMAQAAAFSGIPLIDRFDGDVTAALATGQEVEVDPIEGVVRILAPGST